MCLCLQCAGDAPSIDTAATAAIAVAIAAITGAAHCPDRRGGAARLVLVAARVRVSYGTPEAADLPAHWVFFRWASRSASVGVG